MTTEAAETPRQTPETNRGMAVKAAAAVASAAWKACEWACREAVMPALEWGIPHGAKELSNLLFTGSAYNPSNKSVPMPEHGVHGPEPTPEERAKDAADFQEAVAREKEERADAAREQEASQKNADMWSSFAPRTQAEMPPPEI